MQESFTERIMMSKFAFGHVVHTPAAVSLLAKHAVNMAALLKRHGNGDWGDLGDDDKKENDFAVSSGDQILSSYEVAAGSKVWIVTEGDRSVTTVLLPSDY